MKLKYLICSVRGTESAILFPGTFDHAEVAGKMNVLSAGVCQIGISENEEINVSTFGDSISLQKKPRPEDAELIALSLRIGTF